MYVQWVDPWKHQVPMRVVYGYFYMCSYFDFKPNAPVRSQASYTVYRVSYIACCVRVCVCVCVSDPAPSIHPPILACFFPGFPSRRKLKHSDSPQLPLPLAITHCHRHYLVRRLYATTHSTAAVPAPYIHEDYWDIGPLSPTIYAYLCVHASCSSSIQ